MEKLTKRSELKKLTAIEKVLFEPLKGYIETLKETLEVLNAYFE